MEYDADSRQIHESTSLDEILDISNIEGGQWVKKNTAILVIHGVGNQRPIETIDMFARGLIGAYAEYGGHSNDSLTLTHMLAKKSGDSNEVWFDNYLRINRKDSDKHIDIYEYYWANYPSGKVSLDDMQAWAKRVARGAKDFYSQEKLGERYKDDSIFFKNGRFLRFKYYIFLQLGVVFIPVMNVVLEKTSGWLEKVPGIGLIGEKLGRSIKESVTHLITSVAGDVVAYNTKDPKYGLYEIRKRILDGAVKSLRYLIEPKHGAVKGVKERPYERVVIAAHSLGSQIAFDALNRLNHLISQDEIIGVGNDGRLTSGGVKGGHISSYISGLVTFGSPLDKIAFFFRERSNGGAYIRREMLRNFHTFKQRDWYEGLGTDEFEVKGVLSRHLDKVQWRNYFDPHDPVSGSLDYYGKLDNINCRIRTGKSRNIVSILRNFSHSEYWNLRKMYGDVISKILHQD